LYYESKTMDEIARMDGSQFEMFLARLFSRMGYKNIRLTPANDQGGDLLCVSPSDVTVAIQAKRWNDPVGNDAVHEVLDAMVFYDCAEGMVVTNSVFTNAAKELASKAGIVLHDGRWLQEQINRFLPPNIPEFNWDEYNRVVRNVQFSYHSGRSRRSKRRRGSGQHRDRNWNPAEREENRRATQVESERVAAHAAREAPERRREEEEEWRRQTEQRRREEGERKQQTERQLQEAELKRREQERQKAEALAAERMECWKRSTMPREWVLGHLDGWDQPAWAAMVNRVKATPFWPLELDEIESHLEHLRTELCAERERKRQEERRREAELLRQELAKRERAERLEQWKRSGTPRAWILEHLEGWDHPTFTALLERVKATSFWPLEVDEMIAYLEGLRSELRTEINRKREADRIRQEQERQQCNAAEADERKQQEDAAARPPWQKATIGLPDNVLIRFAWCPPGTFLMGSSERVVGLPLLDAAQRSRDEVYPEEQPAHWVTLTKGFFMGIHPVTQAQWQAMMRTNPSSFKGPNWPVENVSWHDCQQFCKRLTTHLEGKAVVRLPSEAEWEYACRAGTTTDFHFGNDIQTDLAKYDGNESWNDSPRGEYRQQTTAVASFPANAWGLFDMHGNVEEWCEDWLREYDGRDQIDPVQLEEGADPCRVVRGGSWYYSPDYCRSASRNGYGPGYRRMDVGFRVCFNMVDQGDRVEL
jgi:formylglycine-generating enzyme required for sulfatase activity